MRVICYLLILLFSYISGSVSGPPEASPIVTQIQVTLTADGYTSQRCYTDDGHMTQILDYLRQLDPYHAADIDPDTFRTNYWEVVVFYADGNRTVYRQVHTAYLQKDGGIWRHIETEDDLLFLFS